MKKFEKKIVAFIIVFSMIIAQNANFIISYATSNNASDFKMDQDTLIAYTGTDKTVSVPSSIKTIAPSAFEGNTTMETLIIPDTVEIISSRSFADCTGLKKVTIGDGVVEIGSGAFSNCIQLVIAEIGKGLTSIGTGVFAGCYVLDGVTISQDNPYFILEDGALYSKDKEILYQVFAGREGTSFQINSNTVEMKPYAFWGCLNLESIVLHEKITEIGAYTFSNCKSLKSIEIPYSVTKIQLKAFEDCVNLSKVIIGPKVNYIHQTAFDGCVKLYISAEEGTYAYEYALLYDYIKTDQVEYEDTGVDDKEVSDTTIWDEEDTNISFDDSNLIYTKIVGNQAILFIDNTTMEVLDGSDSFDSLEEDLNDSEDELLGDDVLEGEVLEGDVLNTDTKGFSIPKLTIVDNTVIAQQAYYLNEALNEYKIPNSITTIGDFAFARSGLTEITIPSSVTYIGYGAFYHCDDLKAITIPDTVTYIEAKAFEYTQWYKDWEQYSSNDFLVVGDGILIAYKGNEYGIELPEGIKTIAPEVFKDNKKVKEVTLPSTLEVIGEQAFSNCIMLENVIGGVGTKIIEDRAFYNCPIQTVRINADVENIGLGAYASEDSVSDADRTIIFYGDTLPILTNTDSATRLSDEAARQLCFGNIPMAIIENNEIVLENTVLDANQFGFYGLICTVIDEHEIECVATTLTKDELATFDWLEDYYVSGTRYQLENKEEVSNLTITQSTNELAVQGEVLCIVTSSLFPEKEKISATLEGNNGTYLLKVLESEQANSLIMAAYEAVYEDELAYVYGFDMKLLEQPSDIYIEKLGRQNMQLKLPVPIELDQKTFRFVALDGDGQLENIDYTLVKEEEQLYLLSDISHFSTFGFYVTGEIPEGLDATLATDVMDESPDTGMSDYTPIFILIGCIFTSLFLFFIMNKKKTSSI